MPEASVPWPCPPEAPKGVGIYWLLIRQTVIIVKLYNGGGSGEVDPRVSCLKREEPNGEAPGEYPSGIQVAWRGKHPGGC